MYSKRNNDISNRYIRLNKACEKIQINSYGTSFFGKCVISDKEYRRRMKELCVRNNVLFW